MFRLSRSLISFRAPCARSFHSVSSLSNSNAIGSGDSSKLLAKLDMLGLSSTPLNNIDSIGNKGIIFTNGTIIRTQPDRITGALLLGSEIFELNLSFEEGLITITNNFLVEINSKVLKIFELVHPKPELIIIGLGNKSRILSLNNRKFFNSLGIQIELSNSKTAVQNFDLLATERPNQIGGLILPLSF